MAQPPFKTFVDEPRDLVLSTVKSTDRAVYYGHMEPAVVILNSFIIGLFTFHIWTS